MGEMMHSNLANAASKTSSSMATRAHFANLPDDLLACILGFTPPRDVESITVASKTVASHVLPQFAIWKRIFCYRWAMLNFPLDGTHQEDDDPIPVEIDARLHALFPRYRMRLYASQCPPCVYAILLLD